MKIIVNTGSELFCFQGNCTGNYRFRNFYELFVGPFHTLIIQWKCYSSFFQTQMKVERPTITFKGIHNLVLRTYLINAGRVRIFSEI